jgi:hypothetical protein
VAVKETLALVNGLQSCAMMPIQVGQTAWRAMPPPARAGPRYITNQNVA